MKLTVNNFGIIQNGTIELNGITVIAGKNNTGKSTLGKILFCISRAFYNVDERIREERFMQSLSIFRNVISRELGNSRRQPTDRDITDLINDYEDTGEIRIPTWVEKSLSSQQNSDLKTSLKKALDVDGKDILTMILAKTIEAEFGSTINHVNHPRKKVQVSLESDDTDVVTFTKENRKNPVIQTIANLKKDTVLFDGPYLMDELSERIRTTWFFNRFSHEADLWEKFSYDGDKESVINSILGEKSWKELETLLDEMCGGTIVVDRDAGYQYVSSSLKEPLGTDSLSMGLKSILSLKMLLENGSLNHTSVLIFDEPEIHLHPEWQFHLARIMVLLPKILNVQILLSTHSTDFLSAIDYYTSEYNMKEVTRYYLMQKKEDSTTVMNVTEHTDLIYQELSAPFLCVAEKL